MGRRSSFVVVDYFPCVVKYRFACVHHGQGASSAISLNRNRVKRRGVTLLNIRNSPLIENPPRQLTIGTCADGNYSRMVDGCGGQLGSLIGSVLLSIFPCFAISARPTCPLVVDALVPPIPAPPPPRRLV